MAASLISRQALDLNGPSLAPPPGVVPDFDNPPNRNTLAATVNFVCLGLSTVFFLLRIYSKSLTKKWHIGDFLAGLAFIIYVSYIYMGYRLTHSGGYFVHQWDIPLRDIPRFNYVVFVATIQYIVVFALVKIAILIEWNRLFVPNYTRGWFWWTCYIVIGIVAIWHSLALILVNVNCVPYRRSWNVFLPGQCKFNLKTLTVVSACINFTLDMIPLIIPQKIIWSLHLSTSKKLGVSVLFAVGILANVAALIRLVLSVRLLTTTDDTYHYSMTGLISVSEVTCGILILCAPACPKALSGLEVPKAFSSIKSWTSTWTNSLRGSRASRSSRASKTSKAVSDDERSLQNWGSERASSV